MVWYPQRYLLSQTPKKDGLWIESYLPVVQLVSSSLGTKPKGFKWVYRNCIVHANTKYCPRLNLV